jgi:hypothetical protein
MAREIARGCMSLDQLVKDNGVQGVHGRLIDLIDCPERLRAAVEATAGMAHMHMSLYTYAYEFVHSYNCLHLTQNHESIANRVST